MPRLVRTRGVQYIREMQLEALVITLGRGRTYKTETIRASIVDENIYLSQSLKSLQEVQKITC